MRNQDDAKVALVEAAGDKTSVALLAEMKIYAEEFPHDKATIFFWQAFIERRLGNDAKALALYTEAINLNPPACSPPTMSRARLYMDLGEFDKALADIETCLADMRPIPVERFHTELKFQKALIFAVTSDRRFEDVVEQLPSDCVSYGLGAVRSVSDLKALYRNGGRS